MANDKPTIFQRLNMRFGGDRKNSLPQSIPSSAEAMANPDRIIYTSRDKADYERKLATLKQQKYLGYQWKKAVMDNTMMQLNGYTAVKLMYRDVDLMDGTPEIGTALDIMAEETCPISADGTILNIYSKSPRVKSILEDLFINRLHIYTELPMIARHMYKYGNTFMLLNIDADNGILGWMMLPVYEVDRIENGYGASYAQGFFTSASKMKEDDVKFVWAGHNGDNPYFNWQVAHFRLLNDSFFLPYGCSMLHKARRAWRMWSMMEDAMFIWRQDKAVDRRVFKIYVGAIDDEDVDAYVNDIANEFKRAPIIDPDTGQVDLRKNFMDVSSDFFIPVRHEDAPNPIENLPSTNSQLQMEDIEYMQAKMLCALRVPKSFLNFRDGEGKAQNLSFVDVRFARAMNRGQQFLLMELNKIAMIHLYLMGLSDEMGNFSLTLNNPSSQIESMELDDTIKRLGALQTALSDPGTQIPMMSMHQGLKRIMHMSDSEIKDMFNEIMLERAMAEELRNTAAVIKKTGMFDQTYNIYGDYAAMAADSLPKLPQEGDSGFGGAGGGFGAPAGGGMPVDDFGGGFGDAGMEDAGDVNGSTFETGMENAPDADSGNLMEAIHGKKKTVSEQKQAKIKSFTQRYFEMLGEGGEPGHAQKAKAMDFANQVSSMTETLKEMVSKLDSVVDEEQMAKEDIINEAVEDAKRVETI